MQLNYVPPAGATAEAVDAARKLLMTPRNSHNAAVVTLESLAKALVVKGYTNVDLKYLIASILDAQGMSSAVPSDWRARDPEGNVQKKRLRGSPESDASTTDVFKVAKKEQCLFKFRDHACMAIELCANYSSSSPEERQAHLDLHVEAMATKRGRIPEILLETLNRYQKEVLAVPSLEGPSERPSRSRQQATRAGSGTQQVAQHGLTAVYHTGWRRPGFCGTASWRVPADVSPLPHKRKLTWCCATEVPVKESFPEDHLKVNALDHHAAFMN